MINWFQMGAHIKLKYSEREEMFSNEPSHSSFSPPCTTGLLAKWVALHGLIQCSYYFKMDYVFLSWLSCHVLNHPAKSNTEGNERYVSQGHKRELKLNEIHMPALILHYTCSKTSHLLRSFKHQL